MQIAKWQFAIDIIYYTRSFRLLAKVYDFAVLHTRSTKTKVFAANPQGFDKF